MSSCLAKRRWRTTETAFLVAMRAAVSLSMAIRRLHCDDVRWVLLLTQMATRGTGQAVGSVVIPRDTSGSSLHILSRRHHQSSQITSDGDGQYTRGISVGPSGPVLCVATAVGPIMSLRSDQQSKAALNPSRDGGSRPALQECTCHAEAASVRTFTPLVITSAMGREV